MKLIFCPECWDVVKLDVDSVRKCKCEKSSGVYLDDLNATYSGSAVPLGFSNPSLARALRSQPDFAPGRVFDAFVIEKNCPTFIKK